MRFTNWHQAIGLALMTTACGGQARSDENPSSGGVGGSGQGGATTSGGQGGAGGALAACVPERNPPMGLPDCYDLSGLRLKLESASPVVVAPGATVDIQLRLEEVLGTPYGYYPGVSAKTNHAKVSVATEFWLFAIEGCGFYELPLPVTVAADVPVGTDLLVTAWVDTLAENVCEPGHSISIPIRVQ